MPGPRITDHATYLAERFEVLPSGCWQWQLTKTPAGYGIAAYKYHDDGRKRQRQYAHRLAWEVAVGEIPDGLQMDHLCFNPACVNPDHMEPVTASENKRREHSANRDKTHCPQGHPYDEANTYVIPSTGGRLCRTCDRASVNERARRYRERKRKQASDDLGRLLG